MLECGLFQTLPGTLHRRFIADFFINKQLIHLSIAKPEKTNNLYTCLSAGKNAKSAATISSISPWGSAELEGLGRIGRPAPIS